MKTAVVYYSLDGSTRVAAAALAERLGADVLELQEKKKRGKGAALFMAGGFAAALGLKSRLKDTFADQLNSYDRICIGAPIWASSPAPAINTFAGTLKAAGKEVLVFTVQADPNTQTPPPKGVERLCSMIRKKGCKLLPVLRLQGETPGKVASKEHMEEQLDQKLETIIQNR